MLRSATLGATKHPLQCQCGVLFEFDIFRVTSTGELSGSSSIGSVQMLVPETKRSHYHEARVVIHGQTPLQLDLRCFSALITFQHSPCVNPFLPKLKSFSLTYTHAFLPCTMEEQKEFQIANRRLRIQRTTTQEKTHPFLFSDDYGVLDAGTSGGSQKSGVAD